MSLLKKLAAQAVLLAKAVWHREPARVIAGVVSAVVVAAGAFGVVVDVQSAEAIVATVLAILLGGEATRARVTPAR